MINGNYVEFLDSLYHGDELYLKYKGHIYFIQGWSEIQENREIYTMQCVLVDTVPLTALYEISDETMRKCAHHFLEQPIFNGKKLPEIEREVKWVDTEMG
jgi:hypothetical protein